MGPKLIWLFQVFFLFAASSSSSSPPPHLSPFSPPTFANDHLCVHEERFALLQFKHTLTINAYASFWCDGSYPKTASWNESARPDCCSWNGVTCDRLTGHVIGLDLSCSQLFGTIHPNSTLFRLSHLQRLNLAYNDFDGSCILSHAFGILSFASLTHLNLSYSNFAGSIPSEISHLSKFVSLDLSYNYLLSLEPHPFRMLLKNLTRLQELVLTSARISSVLPDSLTNLSSLVALDLSSTGLRGNLPYKIFHLPNLQRLILRANLDLSVTLTEVSWPSGWSSLRELDLSETNSFGTLPDSIGYFKSLNYLNLARCHFSGSIPKSLWNLTQISRLDLSVNNFNGDVPSTLANLKQLTYLSLSSNNLDGTIPDVFAKLVSLETLDLSGNKFNGGLRLSVAANLKQLVILDVSSIPLTGPIPSSLSGLQNLQVLILVNNSLSGTIPSWLLTLPSLEDLQLSDNRLTGRIPEFPFKSPLVSINLSDNKLHGPVPQSISNLVNLTQLSLSSNNLSGIVDLQILSNLKNLEVLDFSRTNLSVSNTRHNSSYNTLLSLTSLSMSSCNIEELPKDFLRSLENLYYLDLSDNRIRGHIPNWFGVIWKDSLEYLNLSHNILTNIKQLPWVNLQTLDLHSNSLQGPLPIPPLSTIYFSISNNNLSGEIPSSICNATSLEILDLSHNNLSGAIPQCLGNFSSVLSVLDLRSNAFQGAIPLTFAKDNNSLRNLDLNGNQFEGLMPRSLTNCRSLEVLDLGNNRFNDTFPYWLGTLPELQVLVLRSNKLHGPIDISNPKNPFLSLRIVDLSHNKFTGHLPRRYFEKFQAMKNKTTPSKKYMGDDGFYYQDSVEVTMKGIEIELVRILTIFTTIDLSSNDFSGEIPDVVGSLNSLIVLNLSHNSLTSHIPGSLGDLTGLESLDLSSNQLTGPIPSQLMSLTFLEILNLSQNHLDGPIPRGNQFGTFGNESYAGNSGLCGFPLTKECANNQTQPLGQEEDDSEYESGFTWEVVVMGYGCGVVFGLLMGGLMFSIGRPRFFVRIVEVERPRRKEIRFNRNSHRQSGYRRR